MGSDQSCQIFCGYHNHINGTIFYAVEPYITCDGCTFGQILDSLTKVSSHELCEAITDPALNAWFDDTPPHNEIGDICNATVQQLGGYTIQLEWSNRANACLLSPPQQVLVHFNNVITGVGGYYATDDDTQHVIVGTSDGNLTEVYWKPAQGVHQGVLAHFSSPIVGVGGYYAADDNSRHAIVGTNDGTLAEIQW